MMRGSGRTSIKSPLSNGHHHHHHNNGGVVISVKQLLCGLILLIGGMVGIVIFVLKSVLQEHEHAMQQQLPATGNMGMMMANQMNPINNLNMNQMNPQQLLQWQQQQQQLLLQQQPQQPGMLPNSNNILQQQPQPQQLTANQNSNPLPNVQQQVQAQAKQAAQEAHDKHQQELQNVHDKAISEVDQVNPNSAVGSNNNKPNLKGTQKVVKDRDGDAVMDDMLAADIAAGHDVDGMKEMVEAPETDVADGEMRWDHADQIPQWLKDYFKWHNEVTPTISKPHWHHLNYITMSCLGGNVCGNVAHRLRPLMSILKIAAETKRVFFIHWDAPDKLEKFLHPPQKGGINWVIPECIIWKIRHSPPLTDIDEIYDQAKQDDRRMVHVMYNNDNHAEPFYDARRQPGEASAQEAFHQVWNVLFKRSLMMDERMHESMRLMGLSPGEYATAHIDYELIPSNPEEESDLKDKVENAMNCMSQLRPGGPFLVAAQTYAIARLAIAYGKQHGVHVHAKQIAHDVSTVPTDLFTSFVEIELMASTRCIAYNQAGYGQLGYMIGYDYNCRIKYTEQQCEWKDPDPAMSQPKRRLLEIAEQ